MGMQREITDEDALMLSVFHRLNQEGKRYALGIVTNLENVFPDRSGGNVIQFPGLAGDQVAKRFPLR